MLNIKPLLHRYSPPTTRIPKPQMKFGCMKPANMMPH